MKPNNMLKKMTRNSKKITKLLRRNKSSKNQTQNKKTGKPKLKKQTLRILNRVRMKSY